MSQPAETPPEHPAAGYLPAVAVVPAHAGMGFDVWVHAPKGRDLGYGPSRGGLRETRARIAENISWPQAAALSDAWAAAGWPIKDD